MAPSPKSSERSSAGIGNAAKRKAPKTLRRTPGVEPKDVRVEIGKGALGSGNFGTVFRGVFAGDAAKGAALAVAIVGAVSVATAGWKRAS